MGNQQARERISTTWIKNKKLWFNSTEETDNKVKMLFDEIKHFDFEPIAQTAEDSIDKVIFCDQIARHLYRNDQEQKQYYHGLAVIEVKKGLVKEYDLQLDPIERCFYLLPLRHTFDPEEILFCINKVQQYLENDSNPIYINFLKASLKAFRKYYYNYNESYQVSWNDLTPILKAVFKGMSLIQIIN